MSDVSEIRAESFREHGGVAIVVVLRTGDELTVTDRSPDFLAALEELRIDANRVFRLATSKRDDRLVLWRAGP